MAKILLDAGHGGKDSGATGHGFLEKNLALNATMQLGGHLRNLGHEVHYTRTDDTFIEVNARPATANHLGADYFFSLHLNSGGGTGCEVWAVSNAKQSTKDMATAMVNALGSHFRNRGVKQGMPGKPTEDFAINRISKMPSALVEICFIDNAEDVKKLSENNNDIMCDLAEAIHSIVGGATQAAPSQSAQPTPAPSNENTGTLVVNHGTWNVRADSSSFAKIVGSVKGGEHHKFNGKKDGWYSLANFGFVGPKAVERTY